MEVNQNVAQRVCCALQFHGTAEIWIDVSVPYGERDNSTIHRNIVFVLRNMRWIDHTTVIFYLILPVETILHVILTRSGAQLSSCCRSPPLTQLESAPCRRPRGNPLPVDPPASKMSAKATINKEVFVPHNEKMLAAVQVKRKTKKKIPFLATGGQGDYMTFICLSGQTFLNVCLNSLADVRNHELVFLCR